MRLSTKIPIRTAKLAKLSAAALAFALLSPAARSQQSTPNPGTDPNNAPVQIISNSQFNQMVSAVSSKKTTPSSSSSNSSVTFSRT